MEQEKTIIVGIGSSILIFSVFLLLLGLGSSMENYFKLQKKNELVKICGEYNYSVEQCLKFHDNLWGVNASAGKYNTNS